MKTSSAPVRRAVLVALGIVPLLFAGCSSLPSAPSLIFGEGTVRYDSLEGGFYEIRTDAGIYDPINLQADARVDGLRVRFVARPRPEMPSAHMVGLIIEIKSLERIP